MNPTSVTILPNATVIVGFNSPDDRDKAAGLFSASNPRELYSKLKVGESNGQHTLAVRVQDISTPVVLSFGGEAAAPPATIGSGTPSYEKLRQIPREDVPGANAEAHTEEAPTTSGVNLTKGIPGAVNNDPSTAMSGAYEGSPGQAIKSATDKQGGPTPPGFMGPDKAAQLKSRSTEDTHPEGQKQDPKAVAAHKAANAEEAKARRDEAEAKRKASDKDKNDEEASRGSKQL